MSKCGWCDHEATDAVILEPARYHAKTGAVVQLPVTAPVCDAHKAVRDNEPGKPIPDMRRRKAKGYDQSTIYDVLGGDDGTGPRSAILGEDAA